MRLQVQRLDQNLPLPRYACEGDAGLDLYAKEPALLGRRGGRATIGTGISVALELGYVGFILPRSGLAAHNGVTVLNAPGIVDSGYRGEVVVVLINHDPEEAFLVNRGDRIAQLVITAATSVQVEEVSVLPSSNRGLSGLGHTGR